MRNTTAAEAPRDSPDGWLQFRPYPTGAKRPPSAQRLEQNETARRKQEHTGQRVSAQEEHTGSEQNHRHRSARRPACSPNVSLEQSAHPTLIRAGRDSRLLFLYRQTILTQLEWSVRLRQASSVGETTSDRAIIHLDMDCFYAAIEVRDRPELAGLPVGVGGTRDRRGVLTTCNYEARKFGVRSAMPTFMALQRCPQLIMVPTRFDVYRKESATIRDVLHRFSHLVEPLSLDEAYLDVSEHSGAPAALAHVIRQLIFARTRLTASAGIGPNKLIAKIASDMNKPDGQCEVTPEQVPEFIAALPVRKLWGIGQVTEQKLERLGVSTCADLQRFSRGELCEHFGKFGLELYDQCRGVDDRPVEPDRERKSLSNEETYSSDLHTVAECEEKLPELFEDLAAELAQKASARVITKIFVKLKFSDFTRTTIERAGLQPSLKKFTGLLQEAFARTGKPVRLIGVGVRFADTEEANASQLALL
jgi:DNA polymerase-4